jgi:ribosomal protein L37E
MARKITSRQALLKKVQECYENLPKLSEYEEECLTYGINLLGRITRGNHCQCLNCGHKWVDIHATTTHKMQCSECGEWLEMNNSRKTRYPEITEYRSITTTFNGLQVIRCYQVERNYFPGRRQDGVEIRSGLNRIRYFECGQIWMDEFGNQVAARRDKKPYYWWCYRVFKDYSPITVRARKDDSMINSNLEFINVAVTDVLPIIKRNGFDGHFCDLNPNEVFENLLKNPTMEMLMKFKEYKMFKYLVRHKTYYNEKERQETNRLLKIATRHHGDLSKPDIWLDMIRMMKKLGMDIFNPMNCAPQDVLAKHDALSAPFARYLEKERQAEAERQAKEKAMKEKEAIEKFNERIKKYLDLDIHDDEGLHITALPTVESFYKEGAAMHHCVGAMEYFKKENSLILSARVNGKRAETIELSLKTYEIIQSRGKCNQDSQYHQRILDLMKKNMKQIQKLA